VSGRINCGFLLWHLAIGPALALTGPLAHAQDRPRLLMTPADVARCRHACGLGRPAAETEGWGPFAGRSMEYRALRDWFAARVEGELLPGELLAAAFLYQLDPRGSTRDGQLQLVEAALQRPDRTAIDPLEAVLALDWCWSDLEPSVRREFLLNVSGRAEPLTPADSPLDGRRFRTKLAALALAAIFEPQDQPGPAWATLRQERLDAARAYFAGTFPTYVSWRGLSPTGPAVAAREECDTALAIEIAGRALKADLWPQYRTTVGRWMEHYVLATLDHPALSHNFIRDDGTSAPLTPVPAWDELLPLTAHLIAARTADPAAALVADRLERALRGQLVGQLPTLWSWVPILLETAGLARCDPGRLPKARNLGGSVIFRGGEGLDTTAVWIDAAQPFLRRGQHFDAGHFLVHRGGHLVVDGGEDVVLEAIPAKGGSQGLGRTVEPFEFEQYCVASIAHNCLVLWEPVRIDRWYKQPFLPVGGQRCLEGTCTDFSTPLADQGRLTGRQLAYGQAEAAAYLALDLRPAYDSRVVTEYTREFLFLCDRVLVVIDRVRPARGRTVPTWVLNLPSRPKADGADLPDDLRTAGTSNQAGVWCCDQTRWLHWTDCDGGLWFQALLPEQRCLRVVGGPAQKQIVAHGRHAGRSYVGGDADGFERLVIPARRPEARNAWYRLGLPTLLGPEFGKTPIWGRIELEPTQPCPAVTFLAVLVTDRADATQPPTAECQRTDQYLVLRLGLDRDQVAVRLPADSCGGGTVEVTGTRSFRWTLPTEVQPDSPLAQN